MLPMYTVTYYKLANRWYLDYPEYLDQGGDHEDLERIGAFREFLDLIAQEETTVILLMDTNPFEGADYLEFVQSSGGKTGGYYSLRSLEGQNVDFELWFNNVIYAGQTTLPQRIYLKKTQSSNRGSHSL